MLILIKEQKKLLKIKFQINPIRKTKTKKNFEFFIKPTKTLVGWVKKKICIFTYITMNAGGRGRPKKKQDDSEEEEESEDDVEDEEEEAEKPAAKPAAGIYT